MPILPACSGVVIHYSYLTERLALFAAKHKQRLSPYPHNVQ